MKVNGIDGIPKGADTFLYLDLGRRRNLRVALAPLINLMDELKGIT